MATDTWANLPVDKRRRITDAAMAEFGTRGFSAGSLNVIARDAGIAKGSLWQYFADKLDLFTTIAEVATQEIEAAAVHGIDLEHDGYFDTVRTIVANWLVWFRRHPLERQMAFAMATEVDAEARGAVRGVTNQHYVRLFGPLARLASERGELREDADLEQLVAMTVLLLRFLDSAPFQSHIDPVLGLDTKPAKHVDRIARELVDTLERGYSPLVPPPGVPARRSASLSAS